MRFNVIILKELRIVCKIVITMITMTTVEAMKATLTMIIIILIMRIIIIFASSVMQTRIKERASRLEDAEKVKQDNRLVHTHFGTNVL